MADPPTPNTGRKRAQLPLTELGSTNRTHALDGQSADEGQGIAPIWDPHLDPRNEHSADLFEASDISSVEDDTRSATDPNHSDQDENGFEIQDMEVPAAVESLGKRSAHCRNRDQTQPHHRYAHFLHQLCALTGTASFENDALHGLPHVSAMICSLDMSESYDDDPKTDVFAYAVVIYTWLLVCKKRLQGALPADDEYLHDRWSAYFLSAVKIYNDQIGATDIEYLAFAVKYWEDRSIDQRRRSLWVRDVWLNSIAVDDIDTPCFRNDQATEYLKILEEHHIEGLTEVLVRREVDLKSSGMREMPNIVAYRWIVAMMTSIDPDLLRAIIEGQVERKARILGTSLSMHLSAMMNDRDPPPSIYQNALCDHEGMSPTPFQWRAVCRLMTRYVSSTSEGEELAMMIDQTLNPSSTWPVPSRQRERKFRRYTEGVRHSLSECTEPSVERRARVRDFVQKLLPRLDAEIALGRGHVPLVAPVVEVGFSDKVHARLSDHRKHRSSNHLMNLAEAAFEYQYEGRFCLQQHIIYNCWRGDQPWASEILLTRLAQGYTTNGGGFSHHGAGFSNGGSWRKRPEKAWACFQSQVLVDPSFRCRTKAVGERAADRALKKKRREEDEDRHIQYVEALSAMVAAATQVQQARRAL
ncbi:MAG: hypothetical protein Q9188_005379 [Gyalolechia gomerana]